MDTPTLENYRNIIEKVLSQYTNIPYVYGEIQNQAIFDRKNDHYLIMSIGWEGARRIHGCLIQVDIIDGKVWVQRDGTEDGVTYELEEAGIPKHDIVLGFHEPDVRQYTGYAVA